MIRKCDPTTSCCVPDRSGPVDGPISALQAERVNLERWRRFVPDSVRFGLARLLSRPAVNQVPIAEARSFERLSPDAVATIQLLDRLGQAVPVGVRYPILNESERIAIEAHSAQLGRPFMLRENMTYFGRYWNAILNARWQLVAERESWQTVPFRGLVVGAGFDSPGGPESRMPITVFEWGAMLDSLGIDWELDVVDPNPEIASYFTDLASRDSLTFRLTDDVTSPAYLPTIFGRYTAGWVNFPFGATVTLPRSFLQRFHFHQGSVVHPLPRTGYRLVYYMNVRQYLGKMLTVPAPPREESIDVANLLLNAAPDAWFQTDGFSTFSGAFQSTPGVERATAVSHTLLRAREPLKGRSYLERGLDGGWRVVTHEAAVKRGGNDSGGGSKVVYRGSDGTTPPADNGIELLGVYPGEVVLSAPSDMVRGGLGLGPSISPEVFGAFDNNLPRLPTRPLLPGGAP
ncbi:MAG: hypothetical protein Q7S98_01910 [Deltaproteobacteria bacterium]|nr:hypothetical protein [Deltaproteobacteria bacterium]